MTTGVRSGNASRETAPRCLPGPSVEQVEFLGDAWR
jgi:hypothetical protein